jgi:hypothetical protein
MGGFNPTPSGYMVLPERRMLKNDDVNSKNRSFQKPVSPRRPASPLVFSSVSPVVGRSERRFFCLSCTKGFYWRAIRVSCRRCAACLLFSRVFVGRECRCRIRCSRGARSVARGAPTGKRSGPPRRHATLSRTHSMGEIKFLLPLDGGARARRLGPLQRPAAGKTPTDHRPPSFHCKLCQVRFLYDPPRVVSRKITVKNIRSARFTFN